ncbi:unnamed protein product [Thelazia callipaeda]|uniref:DREV methyltransferase n=1 Tax=Thelazia callipaeda TaxID=103827 RepID=A0A0N5CWB5_THECL|nr:unnamed protein product [Thelazia callipaeda]
MFRGYRIAQLLMEKPELDYCLLSADHSVWYYIDNALSPIMLEKFHQFHIDEDVHIFLNNSLKISNSICLQVYYSLFTSLLSFIFTKTSINGILGRGGMHLFSLNQLQEFLDIPSDWISFDKRLLDLGAGDGQITATLARLYNFVSVTEASKVMEWRLKQRRFKTIPVDSWHQYGNYHLVSALNLLDRHYNPSLLLARLHSVTSRSKSLLLLAVVLPLYQYVEFHPTGSTTRPGNIELVIKGRTFEEQAISIVKDVFEPSGFELLKWGKLPYLCEGDFRRPFYHLDDAVFLLKPVTDGLYINDYTSDTSTILTPNRDLISL